MMMSKSDDFMHKLRNTINEGKLGLSCPNVVVHIFSGLGGGIGSGIFLDVCYMVREVLKDEENAYISGYFFLPDVNVAHVKSPFLKNNIMMNGYASLQELDYCMNLENNNGSFKQVYKGRKEIEWKLPPVDFCHLISTVDNRGNIRKDAYSYVMKITSEYVLEFLIRADRFSMIDFAEQAYRMDICKEYDRFRGYYSRYLTIGLSSVRIPVKEINTYLASEIFKTFNSKEQDMPSETDIINFAISVMGATNADDDIVVRIYNNLFNALQGAAVENYIQWDGTAKQMKLSGDQDMLTFYEEQTNAKKEILEKNKSAMLDPENSQSLINRLQRTMMDGVITNIQRGPVFGYNIFCGVDGGGLDNIIDFLVTINSNRLRDHQQYTAGKELTYSKAHNAFDNSNFMNRGAAFKECVRSEYDVELQRYKEAAYVQMEQLLMDFKLQVDKMKKDFYRVLAKIYSDIRDTFEKNSAILARGLDGDEFGDFENTLIDITDPNIQAVIQNELGKVTPEKVFKELITTLVDERPMWEDNATISKLVTEFFVGGNGANAFQVDLTNGIFKNFSDEIIENFLQMIYDTEDTDVIADKIQKKLLDKLEQETTLLFYQNTQIYNGKLGVSSYLSVPKETQTFRTAAEKIILNRSDTVLFETDVKDRIVYLTAGFGFPISALNGIADVEREYFSCTRYGIHSYEGEPGAIDIEFDDWGKLPFITPVSILKNREKELPELAQWLLDRILRVYSDILRLKLYDQDMFCREKKFVLYKVDDHLRDDISQLKEQICSFKIHQSGDRAEGAISNKEKTDLQEKIRLIKEKIINGGYYELTQTGFMIIGCMETEEDQKRLLLDQLGYSPVVVLEAEKNIRIIEEALKELSDMMNDIDIGGFVGT